MPRETACPQGTGMSSTVSTAIPHRGSPLRALGLAAEPYLYSAPALILIAAVMLVPLASASPMPSATSSCSTP